MKELTLQQLKAMKPDTIIASGEIQNSPQGLYMTSEPAFQGRMLLWVAKVGGFNDWVIYTGWSTNGLDKILTNGDKVTSRDNIKKLVPVTEEVMDRYRF